MTNKLEADRLRVAVLTGSLGSAGAEKQSYYIARALIEAGVDVRVFTMLRGGEYEEPVRRLGVEPTWIGWLPSPPLRISLLASQLINFRPHVVQSVHGYLNGYCAALGKLLNAVSVGGLRSDLPSFLRDNGRFARQLLTWPDAIAVNSRSAMEQTDQQGLPAARRVYFLPNAIDASHYPEQLKPAEGAECNCIWIGRLLPSKRVDVFLRALAEARAVEPGVRGTVIGYGPEFERVQELGRTLGLMPDGLSFLGFRDDIAVQLQAADALVFTSESEGTPNVILEAMAASLPVISTPAGDAEDLVRGSGCGYVVPFGSVEVLAGAMVRLAHSASTRRRLGLAGRNYVTENYSLSSLAARLFKMYAQVARTSERGRPHPLLTNPQAGTELHLETTQ
jgi:glycosyltransferase involved in cell wall biosynthesis